MWLLNTKTAHLQFFSGPEDVPGGYAILSHVWGDAFEEDSFQKVQDAARQSQERAEAPSAHAEQDSKPSPGVEELQEVIEELDKQTAHRKEDVIITTGVGQHQMWAAQHFRWRTPRSMVTSGGLGTMGFGLPAAIGAKVGAPEKTVVDIDGDASFSMTAMELQTASQFGIGVKVLVLNNEFQGMVQQWQGT